MIKPDFNIRITRKQLLKHVKNSYVNNYYYLIHGRIYNADNTQYRKFKFIVFFDNECILEYYNTDNLIITDNLINDYIDETIFNYTSFINTFSDCNIFYALCNDTIKQYNAIL